VDIVGHLFSAFLAEIIGSIAIEARIFAAHYAAISATIRRILKYMKYNIGLYESQVTFGLLIQAKNRGLEIHIDLV
jgi:hypothetical protein